MTMSTDPSLAQARGLIAAQVPMLQSYLRHLLASHQDADDVVQEVCMTVLEQPAILLRGHEPGAYLRGIARHLIHRHQRRYRSHRSLDLLVDQVWDEADAAQVHEPDPHAAALSICLDTLTARARRLLDLRYRDGLEAASIGEQVRMSAEAVRMALMRARQALARCLHQRQEVGP